VKLPLIFLLTATSLPVAAQNASEFPFYAEITCGRPNGSSKYDIMVCFAAGGAQGPRTELELRNGNQKNFSYKAQELKQYFDYENGTLRVNLRKSFDLKVQNASEHATLFVRIVDAKTNEQIFKDSARDRFAVVSVGN